MSFREDRPGHFSRPADKKDVHAYRGTKFTEDRPGHFVRQDDTPRCRHCGRPRSEHKR